VKFISIYSRYHHFFEYPGILDHLGSLGAVYESALGLITVFKQPFFGLAESFFPQVFA